MTTWIVTKETEKRAGWEYGLPPGIKPEQWPRHATSGLPLIHGFTIHVPEEFRAKGSERVGLSYFHPGDSESYPGKSERVSAVLDGAALEGDEKKDPFFVALAKYAAAEHPATDYFEDILDHTHAIVWHTEAELHGARCPRPAEKPPAGVDPKATHLDDPVSDETPLYFSDAAPERVFIQLGAPLHPVQASAEELEEQGFGECVLEIETDVGGANYGDGNCQIDLENGLLDWACT